MRSRRHSYPSEPHEFISIFSFSFFLDTEERREGNQKFTDLHLSDLKEESDPMYTQLQDKQVQLIKVGSQFLFLQTFSASMDENDIPDRIKCRLMERRYHRSLQKHLKMTSVTRVTPNRSVVLNALINHCSPLLTQSIIECIYHPFCESWRFLNYKNVCSIPSNSSFNLLNYKEPKENNLRQKALTLNCLREITMFLPQSSSTEITGQEAGNTFIYISDWNQKKNINRAFYHINISSFEARLNHNICLLPYQHQFFRNQIKP
ncbi:hypothetical protein YC2023_077819 [Brassica napus]